jgi:hypothetical protein
MVAQADDGAILLIKKLGALASIIVGCILTAAGFTVESPAAIVVGILFLALGIVLLTLKIMRRNRTSPFG